MEKLNYKKYEKAVESSRTDIGKILEQTVLATFKHKKITSEHLIKSSYLDIMFALQKDFEKKWIDFKNNDLKYKEERTAVMIISAIEELIELRREMNTKEWKKTRKKVNPDKVAEELVDVLHFTLAIALIWGITPTSLFEKFIDKQAINRTRQKMKY